MNTWDLVKTRLQSKLSSDAYNNWVAQTTFLRDEGGVLRVSVLDAATKDCMEADYSFAVQSAIRDLGLTVAEVRYEVTKPAGVLACHVNGSANGIGRDRVTEVPVDRLLDLNTVQLNPRFTFETFVVGPCNQFAHAAAQAVAKLPSRSYNPLFIYGGVGMGKTHLMHAIGRTLVDQYGGMRIVYTTSERFINLMINCIRTDRLQHFHQYFRTADVLLIDDIQFLAGKERTQDEFFYCFNELYERQKQIVISSDSQPKHLTNLVERLRSRFEWGLMVDVQPPDLETKMAILDKKAEQDGVLLPEDVRVFIATKTRSNVRELEGALIKLLAYSSMSNTPITLQMAQQVLKSMVQVPEKRITIDAIIRAVAEHAGLQPQQLRQKTNAWTISRPRQMAMYLAKELTQASLHEIGRAFGNKHHTTVLHSIQKIEHARKEDADFHRTINSLIDCIQSN
jgi:chromosomal replication initiator protein